MFGGKVERILFHIDLNFTIQALSVTVTVQGYRKSVTLSDCQSTVLVLRMARRTWKETKQQPGTAGPTRQHAWLLLNFFPFPVGHLGHEDCIQRSLV